MPIAFHLALVFAIPLVITLLITPAVIRLAHVIGAIDRPGARKAHSTPTPRLGGVAVSIAFGISVVLVMMFERVLQFPVWATGQQGITLAIALIVVVLLGVWDDIRELRPKQKFLVQLLLSSVVYLAGFHVSGITDPFGDGKLDLGAFDYIVTVLWIVGVTNAINLIDGLDGLASGVSAIALLTMVPIAIMHEDVGTAVVALILAGAVLGFLRYNFNPARVFLGDSGSLFLGFMLAVLSLQSSTKSTTAFAIMIPIVALGLPIMDTLLSMLRRLLRSLLPSAGAAPARGKWWNSMFVPDRGHIHHQLLARGFSQRHAVLVLYLVSCLLGAGAFVITLANNADAVFVLVVVGIALVVGVRQLRYQEIALLQNGIFLPLFDTQVVNRNVFQVFLDIVFIIVAFAGAYMIHDGARHSRILDPDLVTTVTITACIQFLVFWAMGTYRFSLRQFSLADGLSISKTVFVAVALCGTIYALLPFHVPYVDLTTILLDFYILLTLAVSSRFSFRVLSHIFRKNREGTRKVLIYGADRNGVFALQRILESELEIVSPAGFLDDRPSVEGKRLNGYPVFGGHWKLEQLVNRRMIKEVLLSGDDIKPEVYRRLTKKARELGLSIRRFNVRFDEIVAPGEPAGDTKAVPWPGGADALSNIHQHQ
ncbi:MAG: hypothetical protein IPI01_21265 [Ignavibacteriae bacterium]|nr:hypothetical protein [Ignavibacteriota bacterium]